MQKEIVGGQRPGEQPTKVVSGAISEGEKYTEAYVGHQ